MNRILYFLALLMAATATAQVPPYVRNPYDTNSTAAADARVTGLANASIAASNAHWIASQNGLGSNTILKAVATHVELQNAAGVVLVDVPHNSTGLSLPQGATLPSILGSPGLDIFGAVTMDSTLALPGPVTIGSGDGATILSNSVANTNFSIQAGAATASKVYVTPAGVGIGTNSPQAALHVNGTAQFDNTGSNGTVVSFYAKDSTGKMVETAAPTGSGVGASNAINTVRVDSTIVGQDVTGLTFQQTRNLEWERLSNSGTVTIKPKRLPLATGIDPTNSIIVFNGDSTAINASFETYFTNQFPEFTGIIHSNIHQSGQGYTVLMDRYTNHGRYWFTNSAFSNRFKIYAYVGNENDFDTLSGQIPDLVYSAMTNHFNNVFADGCNMVIWSTVMNREQSISSLYWEGYRQRFNQMVRETPINISKTNRLFVLDRAAYMPNTLDTNNIFRPLFDDPTHPSDDGNLYSQNGLVDILRGIQPYWNRPTYSWEYVQGVHVLYGEHWRGSNGPLRWASISNGNFAISGTYHGNGSGLSNVTTTVPGYFVSNLVAGWGTVVVSNSGAWKVDITNRWHGVHTNVAEVMTSFSDGSNTNAYYITNSLVPNISFWPTNLLEGREISLHFRASTANYNVTITNFSTTVRWPRDFATNGATSFTVTNGQGAEVNLRVTMGEVHAAAIRF